MEDLRAHQRHIHTSPIAAAEKKPAHLRSIHIHRRARSKKNRLSITFISLAHRQTWLLRHAIIIRLSFFGIVHSAFYYCSTMLVYFGMETPRQGINIVVSMFSLCFGWISWTEKKLLKKRKVVCVWERESGGEEEEKTPSYVGFFSGFASAQHAITRFGMSIIVWCSKGNIVEKRSPTESAYGFLHSMLLPSLPFGLCECIGVASQMSCQTACVCVCVCICGVVNIMSRYAGVAGAVAVIHHTKPSWPMRFEWVNLTALAGLTSDHLYRQCGVHLKDNTYAAQLIWFFFFLFFVFFHCYLHNLPIVDAAVAFLEAMLVIQSIKHLKLVGFR